MQYPQKTVQSSRSARTTKKQSDSVIVSQTPPSNPNNETVWINPIDNIRRTWNPVKNDWDIGDLSWSQDVVYTIDSVDFRNQVNWSSGSFIRKDKTYSIIASDTTAILGGYMPDGVPHYVFFDPNISDTQFQITTDPNVAIQSNRYLVMVAVANTVASGNKVQFISYNAGSESVTVLATNVIAATLSAITAFLGSVEISTSGFLRSGQTDYDTGIGFWMGLVGAVPKFSIGDSSSDEAKLLWDGANLIVNGSPITNEDIYGDGSDGDVTISSNTTLTSDMYYNNLTINVGVSLNTGGYRVFVKNVLTNNGTIHRNGNDGGDGGDGSSPGTGGLAGTAGGALANGTLYGGLAGKVGGAGAAGGLGGSNGTSGDNQTESVSEDGTDGGNGGTAGGGAGGTAGTGGTKTDTVQPIRNSILAIIMREFSIANTVKFIKTSAGSGSAGGGGSGGNNGVGGGGGGSGASGGILLLSVRKLINSATGKIQANGGSGGKGGDADSTLPPPINSSGGGGGGGAGGSGGLLYIIYSSLTNDGTAESSGGLGGAKGLGSFEGNPDATKDGVAGNNGNAGTIITLKK